MATRKKSSLFTTVRKDDAPFGPPLIGALLRMPWDAVQQHMLDRLHESGFGDFDAAYLSVFQYPGPTGRSAVGTGRAATNQQAGSQLPARRARTARLSRASSGSRRPSVEAHCPHPTRHRRGGRDPGRRRRGRGRLGSATRSGTVRRAPRPSAPAQPVDLAVAPATDIFRPLGHRGTASLDSERIGENERERAAPPRLALVHLKQGRLSCSRCSCRSRGTCSRSPS